MKAPNLVYANQGDHDMKKIAKMILKLVVFLVRNKGTFQAKFHHCLVIT